jgi:hypothetical protein
LSEIKKHKSSTYIDAKYFDVWSYLKGEQQE